MSEMTFVQLNDGVTTTKSPSSIDDELNVVELTITSNKLGLQLWPYSIIVLIA